MSTPKIRLTEPPTIYVRDPLCSACVEELEHDGDGYTCPQCGTYWDNSAYGSDDSGTLFPDWSGEENAHLPLVRTDDAWIWEAGTGRHELTTDHPFVGVKDSPDDDECTHRADGTDETYCSRPEIEHEETTQ